MSSWESPSITPRPGPANPPARVCTPPELVASEDTQVGRNILYLGSEVIPGYKLVRKLGKGGFGEVWEAKGPGGFSVALKFVHLQGHAAALEVRSLDLMKSLRHPNLLGLFGAWERQGYLIMAMELAEGTLQDRLKQAIASGLPGVPIGELLEVFYEAAKGIDFLNEPRHSLGDGSAPIGIQHRDIKPQNILLLGGSAKVADFGLAKLLESTVCASSGSMSPAYSAPEFSQGKTTRWSDQYSLAVSYCQLRGNRLPFSGTLAQVLAGHLSLPPDLSMIPQEPERQVVARALSKVPDKRWPSCRHFVEALLDSYARLAPAAAAQVKFPSTTGSSLRRKLEPPPLPPSADDEHPLLDIDTTSVPLPPLPRASVTPPRQASAKKDAQTVATPKEPRGGGTMVSPTSEEATPDPNRISSLILLAAVVIIVLFMVFVLFFAKTYMQGKGPGAQRYAREWAMNSSDNAQLL